MFKFYRRSAYRSLDPAKQFDAASGELVANLYDSLLEYDRRRVIKESLLERIIDRRVDVVRRTGGWCEIRRPGPDGWVSCRYLAETGRPGRPDRTGRPDVDIEFSIPGFSFSIGDGRDRWTGRPGRPGRGGQVCFYEDVNYRGDQFCMRPGQSRSSLGNWNDEISSIRVRGGAEARVCEHNGFNGRCATIDRNVRNLGNRGNDMISSIRVR